MDYMDKMDAELVHLRPSNRAYFEEITVYMGLKSFLVDSQALEETLYNMVCDLKAAEADGASAEEYFGKNPQKMVDQILRDTPRRSWNTVWTAVAVIAFMIGAMSFMVDWIWLTPFKLRIFVYVLDMLQAFISLPLIFYILSKTIYREIKKGRVWLTLIILYSLIRGVFRYLKTSYGQLLAVDIPVFAQVGLALLLLAVICIASYKDRYGRGLSITFASLFLAGIYKFTPSLPQSPVIPFVMLVLGVVLGIVVAKKGKK